MYIFLRLTNLNFLNLFRINCLSLNFPTPCRIIMEYHFSNYSFSTKIQHFIKNIRVSNRMSGVKIPCQHALKAAYKLNKAR